MKITHVHTHTHTHLGMGNPAELKEIRDEIVKLNDRAHKIDDGLFAIFELLSTPPVVESPKVRVVVTFGDQSAEFNLDGEIKFMYIVKNDNPDVPFAVVLPEVKDAEGNALSGEELDVEVVSDNPDAVAVTQADDVSGSVHFGNPGLANINATIKDADNGNLLGSFGAQFTVTTGDPASIAGGSIAFEGLTEAAPEPAPEG